MIGVCHILRDIDNNRARSARASDIEGLGNDTGNLGGILDQKAVLYDRAGNPHHIRFLEGIFTYFLSRDLTGDNHQRYGIHVGGSDPGNGIGSTRTGGDQHGTYLPGRTGVTVRRMNSGLLMANQDMLYIRLLEQGVVDMERSAAGVTPDVFNAGIFQCADDYFTARK